MNILPIPDNVRGIMLDEFIQMTKEMQQANDTSLLTLDKFVSRVYPRLTALNDNYLHFNLGLWTAMSWDILPGALLETVIKLNKNK